MKILKHLFESDYDKALRLAREMASSKTPQNVYFKSGEDYGFEEGYKAAMQKRIKETTELSKDEEAALLEFLINNDIELLYDISINGMRARKTNFGWKDNGAKYKHA